MSQRKKRIQIIFFLYRHFLMNYSIIKTKNDIYDYLNFFINQEFYNKFIILLNNLNIIISFINKNLKIGWSFNRLNNLHKAILVYAIFENKYLNISKKIIINEALEILKKYCVDNKYLYINRVLDNIMF